MTKKQRIDAFALLGEYLLSDSEDLRKVIERSHQHNAWFTSANVRKAATAIGRTLTTANLEEWLAPYPFETDTEKTVGLVLAGNIPLVGFHDILCSLCAGFNIQIKPSSDDAVLPGHLLEKLQAIEPLFSTKIHVVERLNQADLIIATGSNNSARYFEYYFGNKPHIIRKNRNSAAILHGDETIHQLGALGHDIFDHFGLGCRNVSKLFIPKGYDISAFFAGITSFGEVINHHKYANNYDYNKSIFLVNGDHHYDNGFLLVKPDERTASPLAVLHLEEYQSIDQLNTRILALAPKLQCIVSSLRWDCPTPIVDPGQTQEPGLDDYADNVNTLDFLTEHD